MFLSFCCSNCSLDFCWFFGFWFFFLLILSYFLLAFWTSCEVRGMFDMRRWLKVMFLCCLKGTTTIPPYRALFTRSHSTIRRPARPSQEFIFFLFSSFFLSFILFASSHWRRCPWGTWSQMGRYLLPMQTVVGLSTGWCATPEH